jgi:hypothetical protein
LQLLSQLLDLAPDIARWNANHARYSAGRISFDMELGNFEKDCITFTYIVYLGVDVRYGIVVLWVRDGAFDRNWNWFFVADCAVKADRRLDLSLYLAPLHTDYIRHA